VAEKIGQHPAAGGSTSIDAAEEHSHSVMSDQP